MSFLALYGRPCSATKWNAINIAEKLEMRFSAANIAIGGRIVRQ
jgi:hypothetical protein